MPLYGSGGFTSYSNDRLRDQLAGWAARGFAGVKIKIGEKAGTRVDRDLQRIEIAREVVGDVVELFVDANGGYGAKQAIRSFRSTSRAAGIREWTRAAALAARHGLEVSGHCAQSLHARPACAVPNLRHLDTSTTMLASTDSSSTECSSPMEESSAPIRRDRARGSM